MKKTVKSILVIMVVMCAVLSRSAAVFAAEAFGEDASDVAVYVNGKSIEFPDQNPVTLKGRLLLPARSVFEGMGFDVSWDEEAKATVLSDGEIVLKIKDGDSIFFINENVVVLDVPARLIGGRMMLPLRAISESVGANVATSDELKLVSIFLA